MTIPDRFTALLNRVPVAWEALAALATACALGVALGVALVGWIGLPADVAANASSILANSSGIEENTARTEANRRVIEYNQVRAEQARDQMDDKLDELRADMETKLNRILCNLEEERRPVPNWQRCERLGDE